MSDEIDSGPGVPAAPVANGVSPDSHPQHEMSPLESLLMKRERVMKQCIHLLQEELERRSNEAVVSAAKFRKMESRLVELNQSETAELPSSQQQQPEDEMKYKRESFSAKTNA